MRLARKLHGRDGRRGGTRRRRLRSRPLHHRRALLPTWRLLAPWYLLAPWRLLAAWYLLAGELGQFSPLRYSRDAGSVVHARHARAGWESHAVLRHRGLVDAGGRQLQAGWGGRLGHARGKLARGKLGRPAWRELAGDR